jgi:hypothetical protein
MVPIIEPLIIKDDVSQKTVGFVFKQYDTSNKKIPAATIGA